MTHTVYPRLALLLALCVAAPAPASEEEGGWKRVSEGPVVVRMRERPGSSVKEVWAEAELQASAADIQATLLEPDRFFRFMPYVKESRTVGRPEPDGGLFVYTRISPPVIGDRDYVTKTYCDERLSEQGEGVFRQRWASVPDRLPQRHSIQRIRLNEGSWRVTPRGEGRSHVVYRFRVDPGSVLPAFIIDEANKSGVAGTLQAVEREAQRRGQERRAVGGSGPGPATGTSAGAASTASVPAPPR